MYKKTLHNHYTNAKYYFKIKYPDHHHNSSVMNLQKIQHTNPLVTLSTYTTLHILWPGSHHSPLGISCLFRHVCSSKILYHIATLAYSLPKFSLTVLSFQEKRDKWTKNIYQKHKLIHIIYQKHVLCRSIYILVRMHCTLRGATFP